MESKNWYQSKIVQVMILQFLYSFSLLVQEFLAKQDFSSVAIAGLISSVVVIVLRVFYTTKPIEQGMVKEVHVDFAATKKFNMPLLEIGTDGNVYLKYQLDDWRFYKKYPDLLIEKRANEKLAEADQTDSEIN
jgi:hypothetical protein